MISTFLPRDYGYTIDLRSSVDMRFYSTFTVVYIFGNKIKEAEMWDIWTSFKMHDKYPSLKNTPEPK